MFPFYSRLSSLYTNIPAKHAIEFMKEIVFEYKDVISNAEFIIDLLELVLENSLMEFRGEYFQQFFGRIMGDKRRTYFGQFVHCKTGKKSEGKNQTWSKIDMA